MLPTWSARGTCRDEDPELFFPLGYGREFTDQIAEAKAICAGCPVRDACLSAALDEAEKHGLWGGLTPDERRQLRRRRRADAAATAAPEGSKACSTCGETKPLTAFYSDGRNRDSRQGRCKACHLDKVATGEDSAPADEEAARRRATLVDA